MKRITPDSNRSSRFTPYVERDLIESGLSPDQTEFIRRCGRARSRAHLTAMAMVYRARLEQPGAGVEVWYYLSRALRKLWDFPGAAAALREAVRREPGYAEAHADLGLCYWILKRYRAAGRHLRMAVMLKPSWSLPWARLALVYNSTGHEEALLAVQRRAVRLCPDDPGMRAFLDDLERKASEREQEDKSNG